MICLSVSVMYFIDIFTNKMFTFTNVQDFLMMFDNEVVRIRYGSDLGFIIYKYMQIIIFNATILFTAC